MENSRLLRQMINAGVDKKLGIKMKSGNGYFGVKIFAWDDKEQPKTIAIKYDGNIETLIDINSIESVSIEL